jgi:hypothetical protein
MGVSLTGVHFTDVYLTGCVTQGRICCERASLAGLSLGHVSHKRAFCGVYLIDVPLIGVHLMTRLSWRASH